MGRQHAHHQEHRLLCSDHPRDVGSQHDAASGVFGALVAAAVVGLMIVLRFGVAGNPA